MPACIDEPGEDQQGNFYTVDDARNTTGLPVFLGPLFGRNDAVVELLALFRAKAARLVTITGPGGVGKTRLALAAGREVASEFDEVHFVQLAPVNDPAVVAFTIAQSVGVSSQSGEDILSAIKASLSRGAHLLILDNFEHVISSVSIVVELLDECPSLKILVTSRSPLLLQSEREFPLEPLDTNAGVNLYLYRAQLLKPGFVPDSIEQHAITSIVMRLDGLPLAIELAAAQSRLMSARAIDSRLDDGIRLLGYPSHDRPERLRTLDAAVKWSYDLLDSDAAKLFRRLSVFSGGASAALLEQLYLELGEQPVQLWRDIETLIVQSLVARVDDPDGEPRLAMLSTIKQFGRDQIQSMGEFETVQAAYVTVFVDYVERVADGLEGRDNARWMAQLGADLDNFRNVLGLLIRNGDARAQLIAGGLWRYWHQRGLLDEGRSWIEQSIRFERDGTLPQLRVLRAGGILALSQGDLDGAAPLLQELLERSQVEHNQIMEANALSHLGVLAEFRGDLVGASDLQRQAAGLFEVEGDIVGGEKSLANLGNVLRKLNELEEARSVITQVLVMQRTGGDLYRMASSLEILAGIDYALNNFDAVVKATEECLDIRKQIGDRFGEMLSLNNLGVAMTELGEPGMARVHLESALAIAQEVGDRGHEGEILNTLGVLAYRTSDFDRAVQLYGYSLQLLRATRGDGHVAEVLRNRGQVEVDRGRTEEAALDFRHALELADSAGRVDVVADSLEGLAATLEGEPEAAITVCAAVAAIRLANRFQMQPFEQEFADRVVNAARSRLSEVEYERAAAIGGAMSLDEATDFARIASLNQVPPLDRSTDSAIVLTSRQKEVLILIAQGKTNREIAVALNIAGKTVEKHADNIFGILDVKNRAAAVAKAVRMGLI